jgi:hypothetical protein
MRVVMLFESRWLDGGGGRLTTGRVHTLDGVRSYQGSF